MQREKKGIIPHSLEKGVKAPTKPHPCPMFSRVGGWGFPVTSALYLPHY